MYCRGIRGAITVGENQSGDILSATTELLSTIFKLNDIQADDIASIFFSVTKDLDAEFPAKAARNMGLNYTPLLCLNEIEVPGYIRKCIRVLIHVNTIKLPQDIQHVYMRDAEQLRPDHKINNPVNS